MEPLFTGETQPLKSRINSVERSPLSAYRLRRESSPELAEARVSHLSHGPSQPDNHHNDIGRSLLQKNSDRGNPSSTPRKRPNVHHRLGLSLIFILIFGTVAILIAASFICFLWFGNKNNRLWHLLAQKRFMTQATTLAALVIRSAIGLQIGACTAMLAAILLERSEVAFKNSAAVSAMRFYSPMPYQLLRYTPSNVPLIGLLSLFMTIFIISQPLSTVLLSDISAGFILGEPQHHSLAAVSKKPGYTSVSPTFLFAVRSTYPMFAEYSEPPVVSDGIHDTGPTFRAFPPLKTVDERTRLRSYRGPARVLDIRVVCLAPSIVNISVSVVRDPSVHAHLSIVGFLNSSLTQSPWKFTCEVPVIISSNLHSLRSWVLTSCFLNGSDTHSGPAKLRHDKLEDFYPRVALVVLNATLPSDIGYQTAESQALWESLTWTPHPPDPNVYGDWAVKSDHEWTTLNHTNSSLPLSLSISVSTCFGQFTAIDLSIVATSKSDQTEPSMIYNATQSSFDTSAVRNQMGVAGMNTTNRGVMKMDPPNFQNRIIRDAWPWTTDPSESSQLNWDFSGSWSFCRSCEDDALRWVHSSHAAAFEDIIRTTWHPTLAIQAWITTGFGMIYHESMLVENGTSDVELVFVVPSQIPQKHTALIFALVGLFIHLALVALTTIAFLSLTRYSLLGDVWYMIAQTASLEVLNILDFPGASVATDREVGKRLEQDGTALLPVQLMPTSRSSDSDEHLDTAVTIAFTDT